MSSLEKFLKAIPEMKFLNGWNLVGLEGKPNFELRYHLGEFIGDVYYTFMKDLRFMNVRTRDGDVLEYYPTATMQEITHFGAPLQYCNVVDFEPYVARTVGKKKATHIYGVANDRHVFKGNLDLADRKIMRWTKSWKMRVYAYVSPLTSQRVRMWREVQEKHEPNYAIYYYDEPSIEPSDELLGFNARNPSYGEHFRLIDP